MMPSWCVIGWVYDDVWLKVYVMCVSVSKVIGGCNEMKDEKEY